MLLSTETLIYYGAGAIAAVEPSVSSVDISIKAIGRGSSALTGSALMPVAHVTGLKNSPVYPQGHGAVITALPKAKARFASNIKVNELSQDDVTGAVLEARVEGDITLKQALRLLISIAAGNATGLDSSPVFKSIDGTKDRITGTLSSGSRHIVSLDVT